MFTFTLTAQHLHLLLEVVTFVVGGFAILVGLAILASWTTFFIAMLQGKPTDMTMGEIWEDWFGR